MCYSKGSQGGEPDCFRYDWFPFCFCCFRYKYFQFPDKLIDFRENKMKKCLRTIAASALSACLLAAAAPAALTANASYGPNGTIKATRTTVSQSTALVPTRMADFVRYERQRLPEGRYWNTGNPNTTSSNRIWDSHDTCLPMGPTVYKHFYQTYWQYMEPYYQCAGFAKKLQIDYFGTDVFTQVGSNPGSYTPQIGDHLRLSISLRNNMHLLDHSIFVTAVNGLSITYADCNADGYCGIDWDQHMTFQRASDGTLYCDLDGYHYEFLWVERPVKLGDANADGLLTDDDIDAMNAVINGTAGYKQMDCDRRSQACDINGDYRIDSRDVSLLRKLLNGTALSQYGFIK